MQLTRSIHPRVPGRDRVQRWALSAFASLVAALVGMVLLSGTADASTIPEVTVALSAPGVAWGDSISATATVTGIPEDGAPTGSVVLDVSRTSGGPFDCFGEETQTSLFSGEEVQISLRANLVPTGSDTSTAEFSGFTPQLSDCRYVLQAHYEGDPHYFSADSFLGNPGDPSVPKFTVGPRASADTFIVDGPECLDVILNDGITPQAPSTRITPDELSTAGASISLLNNAGSMGAETCPSALHYPALRYTPPQGFAGLDTFSYTLRDARLPFEATALVTVTVTGPPDGDGVPPGIESGAPNGGDGNGDGTPDAAQQNVASLPVGSGSGYVTVGTPAGVTLTGVVTQPIPADAPPTPAGATFPVGLVKFNALAATGATVQVKIYLPLGSGMNSYFKLHGCPSACAWADVTSVATFTSNAFADVVTLTLTDGGIGDEDGVANGVIVDPGAPARRAPTNADQCKGDGWRTLRDGTGKPFKNQGDCVSFVTTAKKP